MRASFTTVFSVGCVLVGSAAADAAVLVPSAVLIPAPAELNPVGGVTIASMTVGFSVTGEFSGSVTSEVIAGDLSSPLGGLTFVYTVLNDGVAGPNSIGRVTVDNYASLATDASYFAAGLGVAPASIDRNVSGDVVGFNFHPVPSDPLAGFLVAGSSSRRLVIQTDVAAHALGTMFIIDGGITSAAVFTPVPAPGTLVLFTAASLLGRRRRRS